MIHETLVFDALCTFVVHDDKHISLEYGYYYVTGHRFSGSGNPVAIYNDKTIH